MVLSGLQIERYSRQIIVARVGGRGQERLLGARIALAGRLPDLKAPLEYLAGAGAGTIELCVGAGERGAAEKFAASTRALNPDASVVVAAGGPAREISLALVLVGSEAARQSAMKLADDSRIGAFVIARLDSPGRIAVLPRRSPCPRCANRALLAPMGARAEHAEFVAMAAAAEAFKLAAGYAENPPAAIVEFDGYQSSVRAPEPAPGCACARRQGNS